MSDRELLDLAAKAAGLWDSANDCIDIPWSPLTDDGDALRLAVRLAIEPRRFSEWVTTGIERTGEQSAQIIQESLYPDPYAATRRAIVRAAAAIGAKP